jgi:Arc/MetJ-type ribon-helix-helix transcriptional regulator
MQINVPPDLEVLLQKCLASGRFENAEDIFRRALEALEAEETWIAEERRALDEKIDRAREQAGMGRVYSPDEARQKLDAMRATHLAGLNR